MSRMKLITLTLALLATLLVFTACGNPISEIVHGDPPQAGTPDASDPLSPEPEPEPEETEEQRRARLIKKMEDIFATAEPMENYTFTLNDPVTVEGPGNTTMVCGSASSPITIPSPAIFPP